MSDYKAYIFDFDLTLMNSASGIISCFRATFDAHKEELDFPEFTDEQIRKTIGYTLYDAFPLLLPGISQDLNERLERTYLSMADRFVTKQTEIFPETIPMLERLKEKGAKIAIVSSKRRFRILEALEKYRIEDAFDLIIGKEGATKHKPDPEGLNRAIRELGVAKEEVLYIGDSFLDAGAAENAGVDFAAVLTGTTETETFEHYPHKKIMKSLDEV